MTHDGQRNINNMNFLKRETYMNLSLGPMAFVVRGFLSRMKTENMYGFSTRNQILVTWSRQSQGTGHTCALLQVAWQHPG
jgi:hypothetical protein